MVEQDLQLVTFGESMLRLGVPEGERLETTTSFHVHVGGAESNVATAASRLGLTTAWMSKLPESPLARHIEHTLRGHGVHPAVIHSSDGRVGVYYFEPGPAPRETNVIYDRSSTPIRSATPDELPTELIRDADFFCVSGITPALSDTLATTTESVLQIAEDAGTRTVFDLNYRSKLWTPSEACDTCRDIFDVVDVLALTQRDVHTVLEYDDRTKVETATALANQYDIDTVIITDGSDEVVAVHDDEQFEQPAFDADPIEPIGTGDAFLGGFLANRATGGSMTDALAYGAATAALKTTVTGDIATLGPEEVDRLVAEQTRSINR